MNSQYSNLIGISQSMGQPLLIMLRAVNNRSDVEFARSNVITLIMEALTVYGENDYGLKAEVGLKWRAIRGSNNDLIRRWQRETRLDGQFLDPQFLDQRLKFTVQAEQDDISLEQPIDAASRYFTTASIDTMVQIENVGVEVSVNNVRQQLDVIVEMLKIVYQGSNDSQITRLFNTFINEIRYNTRVSFIERDQQATYDDEEKALSLVITEQALITVCNISTVELIFAMMILFQLQIACDTLERQILPELDSKHELEMLNIITNSLYNKFLPIAVKIAQVLKRFQGIEGISGYIDIETKHVPNNLNQEYEQMIGELEVLLPEGERTQLAGTKELKVDVQNRSIFKQNYSINQLMTTNSNVTDMVTNIRSLGSDALDYIRSPHSKIEVNKDSLTPIMQKVLKETWLSYMRDIGDAAVNVNDTVYIHISTALQIPTYRKDDFKSVVQGVNDQPFESELGGLLTEIEQGNVRYENMGSVVEDIIKRNPYTANQFVYTSFTVQTTMKDVNEQQQSERLAQRLIDVFIEKILELLVLYDSYDDSFYSTQQASLITNLSQIVLDKLIMKVVRISSNVNVPRLSMKQIRLREQGRDRVRRQQQQLADEAEVDPMERLRSERRKIIKTDNLNGTLNKLDGLLDILFGSFTLTLFNPLVGVVTRFATFQQRGMMLDKHPDESSMEGYRDIAITQTEFEDIIEITCIQKMMWYFIKLYFIRNKQIYMQTDIQEMFSDDAFFPLDKTCGEIALFVLHSILAYNQASIKFDHEWWCETDPTLVAFTNSFRNGGYEDKSLKLVIKHIRDCLNKNGQVVIININPLTHVIDIDIEKSDDITENDYVVIATSTHIVPTTHVVAKSIINHTTQWEYILQNCNPNKILGNQVFKDMLKQIEQSNELALNDHVKMMSSCQLSYMNQRRTIPHDIKSKENIVQCVKEIYEIKRGQFSLALFFAQSRLKINAYYDFETTIHRTFDDIIQPDKIPTQRVVAYACRLDIDMRLNELLDLVECDLRMYCTGKRSHNIRQLTTDSKLDPLIDMIMIDKDDEVSLAEFGIDCDYDLLASLIHLQSTIQTRLTLFWVRFRHLVDRHIKQYDNQQQQAKFINNVRELEIGLQQLIPTQLHAYAFNGGKFDTQFILRQIKTLEGTNYINKIHIVGKPTDIFSLTYRDVQFRDSRKKFGSSLEATLKDYGVDEKYWKYKFDFEKLKTYNIAKQHKEEIMYYVKLDAIGLHMAQQKFESAYKDMVEKMCNIMLMKHYEVDTPEDVADMYEMKYPGSTHMNICKSKWFRKDGRLNMSRYLRGLWRDDALTISQISMKMYKQFFSRFTLKGCDRADINKLIGQAYSGGLVTTLALGEVKLPSKVFVLDINSMYPSIMQAYQVPTSVKQSKFARYDIDPQDKTWHFKQSDDYHEKMCSVYRLDKDFTMEDFNMKLPYGLCRHTVIPQDMGIGFGDYNIYFLSYFKFNEKRTFQPLITIKTKLNGNQYFLEYDESIDGDKLREGSSVNIFGFQLRQLMVEGYLQEVRVKCALMFDPKKKHTRVPAYKEFIDILYEERRLTDKKSLKNVMKLTMNSFYGKLGQKPFPIRIIMDIQDFHDDVRFRQIVKRSLMNSVECDVKSVFGDEGLDNNGTQSLNAHVDNSYLNKISFSSRIFPDDPTKMFVNIKDYPTTCAGVNAQQYHAAMITAMGRTGLGVMINAIRDPCDDDNGGGEGEVYACDTDSIICNERAFQVILNLYGDEVLDGSKLGALKNEFPKNGNQMKTDIVSAFFLNKKMKSFTLTDGSTHVTCKGIRNAGDDILQRIVRDGIHFEHNQTRFRKDQFGGNVYITESIIKMMTRLSRHFPEWNTQGQKYLITSPYRNFKQHSLDYSGDKVVYFDSARDQYRLATQSEIKNINLKDIEFEKQLEAIQEEEEQWSNNSLEMTKKPCQMTSSVKNLNITQEQQMYQDDQEMIASPRTIANRRREAQEEYDAEYAHYWDKIEKQVNQHMEEDSKNNSMDEEELEEFLNHLARDTQENHKNLQQQVMTTLKRQEVTMMNSPIIAENHYNSPILSPDTIALKDNLSWGQQKVLEESTITSQFLHLTFNSSLDRETGTVIQCAMSQISNESLPPSANATIESWSSKVQVTKDGSFYVTTTLLLHYNSAVGAKLEVFNIPSRSYRQFVLAMISNLALATTEQILKQKVTWLSEENSLPDCAIQYILKVDNAQPHSRF